MRFAVVVVTWNGERWIAECLDSIASQRTISHLIIVDNGSGDGTVGIAEGSRTTFEGREVRFEVIRLETNTGFVAGANRGLEIGLGGPDPVLGTLLLNQDAVLEPGCMEAFADTMQRHPRAGAIGAKILYPGNGLIQHAGGYLEKLRMVGFHHGHHESEEGAYEDEREVEFVTGAAMMLRIEALREVGLFNDVFSPGYYEDVELCLRLRDAGWPVIYAPTARVQHHESSSFADREARLRLAHRNRFVYALPRFDDDDFSESFLAAEIGFLEGQASLDEVRAVSGGTLEALARLVPFSRLRSGERTAATPWMDNARRVLVEVRKACKRLLRDQ